jgi:N-acetylglucosamine-6-sulfatase
VGGRPPAFVNGKSLVPLLDSIPPTVGNWRTGILTENWGTETAGGMSNAPTHRALRTKNFSWVRYANGKRELYDMRNDPYQVKYREPGDNQRLERRSNIQLERLFNCDGVKCRVAETG